METRVKGKNFEVSDGLRRHVQERMQRLERYMDSVQDAQVELSQEKTRRDTDRYIAQVTMWANGTVLRGEEKASDIHHAIEGVFDTMHERLVRFKEKRYRRTGHRRPAHLGVALAETPAPPTPAEDESLDIVRVKSMAVKPMSAEDAIEQLEMLGHDFYVFLDAATTRVSVLYRRREGGYGLIRPEPA